MQNKLSGFTLIEMSIVLVIIGLIVGGVLAGRDLISTAYVRAQISQIEKYNQEVNTFYSKYQALPGDMGPAQASQFGLFTFTGATAGTAGYGNQDGVLASPLDYVPPSWLITYGEPTVFWRHLSDAHLIDGSFGVSGSTALLTSSGAPAAGNLSNTQIPGLLPSAALGQGIFISVFGYTGPNPGTMAQSGANYFFLSTVTADILGFEATFSVGPTTLQSYAIDSKIDDGYSNTGRVMDVIGFGYGFPGYRCTSSGGPNYDLTPSYSNLPNCMLAIRFQ